MERRLRIEHIVIWYVPRQFKNDSREGQEYCWVDTRLDNGNLVVKEFHVL